MIRPILYIPLAYLVFASQFNCISTLKCLSCQDVMHASDCNNIEECSRDELCFYHKGNIMAAVNNDIRVEVRCVSKRLCTSLSHLYQGASSTIGCCNDSDLCNNVTFAPKTMSTSTAPSMTTLPRTTSSSAKIAINAPDKAAYLNMVQLQCVTIPPAEKYSWKFNGVGTVLYLPTKTF